MYALRPLDVAVLLAYMLGVVGLGCWFARRRRGADVFMTGERNLPAWVVGLSIFGTFVSSISFLALPGDAFDHNWNAFVFSLSLPLAAWISTRYFVRAFRTAGAVSAYEHLERRFGTWARVYASVCYLLTQVGRTGTILYLLALPLHELLGWDVRLIIVVVGAMTTVYTVLGGIEGVIWTDVVQSIVLIAGAILCVVLIPLELPGGFGQVVEIASDHDKFSLGSFGPSLQESTFWVVFAFGLTINLQNFGIDQSYVQRYLTAKTDRAARRSVWLGALLYIPVAVCFFFIGTSLFAYYTVNPGDLPKGSSGDRVFPYYMVTRLPSGCAGLLIAAVFAAAMSTISTSLNCAATLTLNDYARRFLRGPWANRRSMAWLYGSTLAWGVLGTAAGLAMIQVESALKAWWRLSGAFGGGMLGLFLLGLLCPRAGSRAASGAVLMGVVIIVWMNLAAVDLVWPGKDGPFHPLLSIVFGTAAILAIGFALSFLFPAPVRRELPSHSHTP